MSFLFQLLMTFHQGDWRPNRPEQPYVFRSQMFAIAMGILLLVSAPIISVIGAILVAFPTMIFYLALCVLIIWWLCPRTS